MIRKKKIFIQATQMDVINAQEVFMNLHYKIVLGIMYFPNRLIRLTLFLSLKRVVTEVGRLIEFSKIIVIPYEINNVMKFNFWCKINHFLSLHDKLSFGTYNFHNIM